MPRVRPTSEETHTNGRNGHGAESDARRQLALLVVAGSLSDAESAFLATPGASSDEWVELERSLRPLRKFVLEGEAPYVRSLSVMQTEYQGTPTPCGDCADDALPPELRNQNRAAIRARMSDEASVR